MLTKVAANQLEDAYACFRLDRQAIPVSTKTLKTYKFHLTPFFRWLRANHLGVEAVAEVDANHLRAYRALKTGSPGLLGIRDRKMGGRTAEPPSQGLVQATGVPAV